MNQQNKTVLITGATSGIGLELARLFARDHYNMVIVSRSPANLARTEEVLKAEGAAEITSIVKDLSIPGSAAEVYSTTRDKGILVNVLVNDAGVGEYGLFEDTDLDKELSLIHLNITSMVALTKYYLKDMLSAKGGRILQLGSVASYEPTPKLGVYAATKAFILSFSDALGTELKNTPVTVTTLIPTATDTDFFRKAGMENTKAAVENPEDPTVVAKIGYSALMNGDSHAYAPGARRAAAMGSVLPNRTVAGMAKKDTEKAQGPHKKGQGH